MPKNKNAQLRYKILDSCFSNDCIRYTFEDLMDEVNRRLYDINGTTVSIRQLRYDMEEMKNSPYFAPIQAYRIEGNKCYYRYSDTTFSIFKIALSSEELHNLQSTIEILGRFRGIPSNSWLEEMINNLEYRFGIHPDCENIIAFEQNEQLLGLDFLSDLISAAVNHSVLSITYRPFSGKQFTATVHPYHIRQYNNRWFLFGLEESTLHGRQLKTMALDRIQKFRIVEDITFIPNAEYDFKTYFKDIIGVTIPKDHPDPETIILRFDTNRFPYVVSKPLHHTQKVISEEQHTVSIKVRVNPELESQIFSFGPQVEVLEPEWFRKSIAKKMDDGLRNYSGEDD